jgi:hypothetical protein
MGAPAPETETQKEEEVNLIEGLIEQMNRNRELVEAYKSIGIPGTFGAAMLTADIQAAEKAMGEGDTVAMLKCFAALKENK